MPISGNTWPDMGPKQISIIVVSFNVCELLRRCLTSLPADADVVVVDNASTDGSQEMVARAFPQVTGVFLADNRGFSAAVNLGARRARGDALLLLNPDTQLPVRALDAMAAALGATADTAIVGFRQVDAEGTFQLAVGPKPTLLGELARRCVQRRLDRGGVWLAKSLDRMLWRRCSVAWVAGSSLLVWRSVFDAVGGFDDAYFLFFEDIDFCLRVTTRLKRSVYYDPRVTVLHHRGASAAKHPGPAMQAYRASQVRFWRTHRGGAMGSVVARYVAWRHVHKQAGCQ
jgi:N-acetylglucosaminyl-diphospho-decaprenol L-rhamnosyltransferase